MSLLPIALALLNVDKPVLRVFVLSECPISRQYVPELKRLSVKYGVPLELVFEDSTDAAAKGKAFLKEFQLRATVLTDNAHYLARESEVKVVPTASLLVGRKVVYSGRIDDRFPALRVQRTPRAHDLEDAIRLTLAGKRVLVSKTVAVGCVLPD